MTDKILFLKNGWHERSLLAEKSFLEKELRKKTEMFLQNNFKKQPFMKGLYIQGEVGSGKTMLMSLIAQWIANEHEIIPSFKTIYELRSASMRDEEYREIVRLPILCIDDFGIESGTNFSYFSNFQIIDDRYSRMLPTFFTSNTAVDDLEKRLSRRIKEMCEIITKKNK